MVADQRGITLVEMVVTIIILAIALTGVTVMLSRGIGGSGDVLVETRAVALAQSYLQEITGRRFDENSDPRGIPPCWTGEPGLDDCSLDADFGEGVDPGEGTRPRYDDVDDYDSLDEGWNSENDDPLFDADGEERTGYDSFRVQVTVRYIDPGSGGEEENLGDNLTAPEDAKLITVTVSHPQEPDGWDFSVYKTNF